MLLPNAGATDFDVASPGQLSWSVSGSAGERKDLFAGNISGTPTIVASAAWTNNTTRSDGLDVLKGVKVNAGTIGSLGAKKGIWLGSVYIRGTNTLDLSANHVDIWNRYNRLPWAVYALESAASWTYATATIRQANGSSANQIEWMCGEAGGTVFDGRILVFANVAGGDAAWVRFGVDSTSAYEATATGAQITPGTAIGLGMSQLSYKSPIGYHYASWLEKANGNTATFYSATNGMASGIIGTVMQ